MPSYPAPAYGQGSPSPYDQERQKQIDRTRTGVFLLLVGTLLGWIPIVQYFGYLLILIGAILVILGRKAFGATHARNVMISILVFFLTIIIVVVGAIILGFTIAAGFVGGGVLARDALQSALTNFLIIYAIAGVVGGLASLFFTYALQNQTGKRLLLGGYVASVVTSIAIIAVVIGSVPEFVAAACPSGACDQNATYAATSSFQGRVGAWGLLSVIPSLLYAGAYYLVWNRVKKGEIPGPTMVPGMAAQPASPIQPR
jgi:hypothetical protein